MANSNLKTCRVLSETGPLIDLVLKESWIQDLIARSVIFNQVPDWMKLGTLLGCQINSHPEQEFKEASDLYHGYLEPKSWTGGNLNAWEELR